MGDENIGRVLAGKYELVRVLGQGEWAPSTRGATRSASA